MEEKIIINDIFPHIGNQSGLSVEEVEVFVKELFAIIENELSEENPIKIKDFGTFKLTPIQARESVDVNTGAKIEIPAHNRVSFLPATALKELVNKPFSHFETTMLNEGFSFDDIPVSEEEFDEEVETLTFETETEQHVAPETPLVQIEETHNPVFEEELAPTLQATNITETILPQTRIHTITKSSKKTPYGIWGVLAAAAAIITTSFIIRKR